MIKAVIFDVGGVLVRTKDPAPRRALDVAHGLAAGQVEALVFNSDMGQAAQRGEISAVELWSWVAAQLHLPPQDASDLAWAFFAGDRLDTEIVAFIRTLRPRYRTAIISNAADNLTRFITDDFPMIDAFDLVVGSAYEGVMKPDPAIFRTTLDRLGVAPDEAVFIDDFAHNIAGAEAVGMHGIHFTPGIDLPAALARLGVN